MSTRHYKFGVNRTQSSMFPASLDDYVSEGNTVRAIDAYVSTLQLAELGFKHANSDSGSGQPAYHPGDLLKLYLYGYINHIRSSRRLERETRRNVEVMWLLGHLHPSYKTIADFRKDNPKALKEVNRDFILLCRELNLFGGKKVAIDGSFFRANAGKASITTQTKLKKQIEKLNHRIEAYHQELDSNDQQEGRENRTGTSEDKGLQEKLGRLKKRQKEKQYQLKTLENSEQGQLSRTDPDARLLSKSGQQVAGYNVQVAIDDKYHLIIGSKVTNDSNDQHQLYPLAAQAKEALEMEGLTVLADAGYYEGHQLKQCEDSNITAYVPEPDKKRAIKAQGRYTRQAFHYDADNNVYICPNGQALEQSGLAFEKNGKMRFRYTSKKSLCENCPLRSKCLTGKAEYRQLYRWEHEEVLERHRERMQNAQQEMAERASLVEHPFGTLKDRAGWTYHFLVRGFKKVQGEWSLMAMGYNFTRVLNIIGLGALVNYCIERNQNWCWNDR